MGRCSANTASLFSMVQDAGHSHHGRPDASRSAAYRACWSSQRGCPSSPPAHRSPSVPRACRRLSTARISRSDFHSRTATKFTRSLFAGGSARSDAASRPMSTRSSRSMRSGLPANVLHDPYGEPSSPVGPSGNICQQVAPDAASQSTKSRADRPRSPMPCPPGSEVGCSRTPAARDRWLVMAAENRGAWTDVPHRTCGSRIASVCVPMGRCGIQLP